MYFSDLTRFPGLERASTQLHSQFAKAFISLKDLYEDFYDLEYSFDDYWKEIFRENISDDQLSRIMIHEGQRFDHAEDISRTYSNQLLFLGIFLSFVVKNIETKNLEDAWKNLTKAYKCTGDLHRILEFDRLDREFKKRSEIAANAANIRHQFQTKKLKSIILQTLDENFPNHKWKTIKKCLEDIKADFEKTLKSSRTHKISDSGQEEYTVENVLSRVSKWRHRDEKFKESFDKYLKNKREIKIRTPLKEPRNSSVQHLHATLADWRN